MSSFDFLNKVPHLQYSTNCCVTDEHANVVASSVQFDISERQPPIPEYSELFVLLCKQISFSESIRTSDRISALTTTSRAPFVHNGGKRNFKTQYFSHSHEWMDAADVKPEDMIKTGTFKSSDVAPVLVLRVFNKDSGRLLGFTRIPTCDLVDSLNPWNYSHRQIEPVFRYELIERSVLDNSPNPRGRSFDSVWRARQYLLSAGVNINMSHFESVADASYWHGESVELLCSSFGCRCCNISGLSGDLSFVSYFTSRNAGLKDPNGGDLKHYLQSLQTFDQSDKFGAPVLRIPFNPNLPVVQKILEKKEMNLVEFETNDAQNFREGETLDDILHQDSIRRWKTFFLTSNEVENGPQQWEAIETAYATSEKTSSFNVDWQRAVNKIHRQNLPRFSLEVWCSGQFCGEMLLPPIADLKAVFQSKQLHKLQPWISGKSVTRADMMKSAATYPITGWINFNATWRCLNRRAARLNLCVTELRDISTGSCSRTDLMPGAPQIFVFMKTSTEWVEVQKFTPFEMASYFLHPNQAAESMESSWVWDAETMGMSEPDWKNYFSYDEPNRVVVEERDIPITIAQNQSASQISRLAKIGTRDIRDEQESLTSDVWRLCKGGIPSLMRSYLWMEISGAQKLMEYCNELFKAYPPLQKKGHKTPFEFLARQADSQKLVIFDQVEHDLRELQIRFGITGEKSN